METGNVDELSIDKNIKILVLLSLAIHKDRKQAAKSLEISERTLYRYIKKYKIKQP